MIIGIPKEIKEQEHRVALLPSGAYQLAKRHQVLFETGAGVDIGMSDQDYQNAGAEIVQRHEDIFARADLVAKVKEPLPSVSKSISSGCGSSISR
jgi:alanine dehydrogenase